MSGIACLIPKGKVCSKEPYLNGRCKGCRYYAEYWQKTYSDFLKTRLSEERKHVGKVAGRSL